MSILIKGMEMPKSCRKCMISQPDGCGWICPIIESKPIVDGRVNSLHPRCPLVEIPPHGDLIDRDKLRGAMFIGEQCLYAWDEIEDAIDSAPTILDAEEGET